MDETKSSKLNFFFLFLPFFSFLWGGGGGASGSEEGLWAAHNLSWGRITPTFPGGPQAGLP